MLGWFRADAAWGTLKTGERLRVAGNFRRQEFEGDASDAAEYPRLCKPRHSAAAAELLDNAVVRDGLADHS